MHMIYNWYFLWLKMFMIETLNDIKLLSAFPKSEITKYPPPQKNPENKRKAVNVTANKLGLLLC